MARNNRYNNGSDRRPEKTPEEGLEEEVAVEMEDFHSINTEMIKKEEIVK